MLVEDGHLARFLVQIIYSILTASEVHVAVLCFSLMHKLSVHIFLGKWRSDVIARALALVVSSCCRIKCIWLCVTCMWSISQWQFKV